MIIGIVGFAGSGKGTVADMLVDEYGYSKMAFADPLKDATATIFGWPREMVEGDTKESREWREKPDEWWSERLGFEVTPRWALQKMGTEAGRNVFHKDMWIYALERRITTENVVVADVRFPNEIEKIKSLGGHVIRVVRGPEPEWYDTAYRTNFPESDRTNFMEKLYPDVHESEWAWIGSKFDYVLDNGGTLRDLKANLDHMLKLFTGPGERNSSI